MTGRKLKHNIIKTGIRLRNVRTISLLDCTLRDGGYVNDWNFGNGNISCIINRLCESKVDIIEVGFLDERRPSDMDHSIQPDTASMTKLIRDIGPKGPTIVAMIDYGTCGIDKIQDKKDTCLDGIRIIFKKAKVDGALAFAKEVKKKGYLVFLQMVSITSYDDYDLLEFIKKANDVGPYAVSIVDTYGLLDRKQLLHYYDILDRNLDDEIQIGYHSHNNFQLGYSNSISMLEFPSNRDVLVDGTMYGMGKSAGNAPLELLAMYMNQTNGNKYNISSILEAIDNNIMNIFKNKPWGYSYIYYISALNDCHPNYVSYLLDKNTLSVHSINEILTQIPKDNKLLYSKDVIEQLYRDHQRTEINDTSDIKNLSEQFTGKKLLLIGPGRSIVSEKTKIENWIEQNNPVIISVNSAPDMYNLDYVFISSSKRYNLDYNNLKKYANITIATSNINPTGIAFKYVINYDSLRKIINDSSGDNSLILLLSLLCRIGIREVHLAGFDGFSENQEESYYDTRLVVGNKSDVKAYNAQMSNVLRQFTERMSIDILTMTNYKIE